MQDTETNIENVTVSEIMALDTWNRPRTDEEIQTFLKTREEAVGTL